MGAIATGSTLFAPSSAQADDTAELRGLLDESVVTTASKSAETATNAPATSTTLNADDLRRYGIHTVDEAINFLSLGASSSSALYTPDVAARGVGLDGDRGDHVLLLVDGHTMNDALFGLARFGRGMGVPMELVDRIEIVLGPGSVLYGSSAMLAVINIVTKRAKEHTGTHVVAEMEPGLSYRGGINAAYPFQIFGAPAEIVIGAEYYQSDGPYLNFPPQNAGVNPYTGEPWRFERGRPATGIWGGTPTETPYARVPAGFLTARVGDFRLAVQASTFKQSTPYRARHIQNAADWDDPDTYEIDRALRGELSWERRVTELLKLKARAYIDSFDNRRFVIFSDFIMCRYRGTVGCRTEEISATKWGGAELQASFDWGRDGSEVTMLGVDARWRYVQGKKENFDYDTGEKIWNADAAFKKTGPTLGPYLQHVAQLTNWLAVNAGARLDYDSRFDPVVSPRAALMIKPWHNGMLKAVYAEAFRAPSFSESDTYWVTQLRAGTLVPERVRSLEASLEQKFGSQRLLFGAFRSWWSNLIQPHVLTPAEKDEEVRKGTINFTYSNGSITQYRNVSQIENYGFNSAYEGSTVGGQLRFGANFTGAIARRISGDVDLPLTVAPNVFGNVHVSYDLRGDLPTLALAGYYNGRRIGDRAWDGALTSYPIAPPQVELRATVSGPVPGLTGLSYRLSANYAVANHGPYVVGFFQGGSFQSPETVQLVPLDTFRTTIGLQYDFLR